MRIIENPTRKEIHPYGKRSWKLRPPGLEYMYPHTHIYIYIYTVLSSLEIQGCRKSRLVNNPGWSTVKAMSAVKACQRSRLVIPISQLDQNSSRRQNAKHRQNSSRRQNAKHRQKKWNNSSGTPHLTERLQREPILRPHKIIWLECISKLKLLINLKDNLSSLQSWQVLSNSWWRMMMMMMMMMMMRMIVCTTTTYYYSDYYYYYYYYFYYSTCDHSLAFLKISKEFLGYLMIYYDFLGSLRISCGFLGFIMIA